MDDYKELLELIIKEIEAIDEIVAEKYKNLLSKGKTKEIIKLMKKERDDIKEVIYETLKACEFEKVEQERMLSLARLKQISFIKKTSLSGDGFIIFEVDHEKK